VWAVAIVASLVFLISYVRQLVRYQASYDGIETRD
jgi:hypothetical protein